MNILRLLRLLLWSLMPSIVEGEGGGVAEVVAPGATPTAPAAEVVPASGAPAAPTTPAAPATMLDAMFAKPEADPAALPGRPRDEHGRFLPKPGEPALPAVAPGVDHEKAALAKPAEPDDPTKPPEGLTPKASERFQLLANTNKELSGRVELLDQQVSYIRETFETHGVSRQQFEQAASFIGAINKGDFSAALEIIEAQRAQLAIASGKPLPGVDVLTDFPDLRAEVDAQQITEARALEIARHRYGQHHLAQQETERRTAQQTQEQQQRSVNEGLSGVDKFCKQMQASDIDYPAIEAQLLPKIKAITDGVPPSMWAAKVQAAYELIKGVASTRTAAPSVQPLRPTGATSPGASPQSMFEAMWKKTA